MSLSLANQVTLAARAAAPRVAASLAIPLARKFATVSPVTSGARNHKVVVVGGGAAGLSISHQLLRHGKFTKDDIAIIDPAEFNHYQPGWTLVGGGLKTREQLQVPIKDVVDPKLKFYNTDVTTLNPEQDSLTLGSGDKLTYEHLIVVPGIKINYASIKGLPEALANPDSMVSSTYGYETCPKVFGTIKKLSAGKAIFTQPAGVIKCAGAPQKIMWLALDHWKKAGLYNPASPASSSIQIAFANGLPTMFGVPKYSATLERLRQERGVEGLFQHDLVSVEGNKATFSHNGESVTRAFDLLHVVPKMGPHSFVADSALANEAGYVDVSQTNLRSTKFPNVWSAGDASSLPTSKTAAAITAQAPVLVGNLLRTMEGKEPGLEYDGYTSCPLTTEYGKVLLAEFKYGGVPEETFSMLGINQAEPQRAFYYMKKDFFPWVYQKFMLKGTWAGPKGFVQ